MNNDDKVTPVIGGVVRRGKRTISDVLLEGDKFCDSGYPGCQFRIKLWIDGPIKSIAVNVKITGKTWTKYNGSFWVRCQIEYVGDCEPSTFEQGWYKVA